MAYRNGTYVAFHADGNNLPGGKSDIDYYRMLQAWSAHPDDEFTLVNSHEKASAVRDSSLKATLRGGMYRLEAVTHLSILRMLPYLKYRNAHGAHLYLRPTGESAYTLLDDLTPVTLARLNARGYRNAAVVEISRGNFQAWLRHTESLSKELGTLAAKTLAAHFGANGGTADWRGFGRIPGFTNRKPQYRDAGGLYPFARLIGHSGEPFPIAAPFRSQLLALQRQIEQKRTALRLSYPARPSGLALPITLARFRTSPRYGDRPAAADMAFSIAAFAQGWSEADIAAALRRDYLSRDTNPAR